MKEKEYLIALSTFIAFGPTRINLLKNYFGTYRAVWESKTSVLSKIGLSAKIVETFDKYRRGFNIGNYLEKLESNNISVITISSENYPANLKRITGAPLTLYIKGKLLDKDVNAIAIVGTRKMSSYGAEVTKVFSSKLAASGVTIVSGLAYGVDAMAHKAALSAHGRTIAVLPGGLDRVYPAANAGLARDIIKNGSAIVSEYPLGYPPLRVNFVMRNRIVSGLSRGVLVVEGRAKSGTLLTAGHAADQGIDVYAVPGPIYSPLSEATNYLLKNGAKLAASPRDILDELSISHENPIRPSEIPSDSELRVLSVLDSGPLHIDEVVRMCSGDTCDIVSILSMMEIKGMVKSIGGGVYKKL